MKKMLLAAAAAVVGLGTAALADDAMMKAPMMQATMMCRPAMKSEKPEAMMGNKGMTCKTMSGKMGPDTTGMDKAATDKAWRAWIEQAMMIPLSGNG